MTLNQSFYHQHDCPSVTFHVPPRSTATHSPLDTLPHLHSRGRYRPPHTMAHTILLPYSVMINSRTPKRRHWRRHTTTTTTMIINSTAKHVHSSPSLSVHNSVSNLPDIVNDCHEGRRASRVDDTNRDEMKLTCKQIAHSLRLVADQVDQKYCQVSVNCLLSCLFQSVFHTFLSFSSRTRRFIEIFNV